MTRQSYTVQIKAKGWKLKEALRYWRRPARWYQNNANGDEGQRTRLQCLIDGLEDKKAGSKKTQSEGL